MARGRQRDAEVGVVALSLTLDTQHAGFLDRVVRTGRYGRSRSDVASTIIRFWLADNLTALEDQYRRMQGGADTPA
jgi:Arc/MetJ-type ribon-helix-helix transcriptional regulator